MTLDSRMTALLKKLATAIIAMTISTIGAELQYSRNEEFSAGKLGERQRQVDKPFLFAEVIAKYGVYQNFLHYYIERPLFFDRSMRNENVFEGFTKRNFIQSEIPAIQAAGLDGFGTFCVSKGSAVFKYLPWLQEENARGFMLLPEYLYGERIPPDGGRILKVEAIADMIGQLQNCAYGPKTTDGRLLLGSWNSQVLTMEEHKRLLDAMRKDAGTDRFCLTGEIYIRTREALEGEFRRNGALKESQRNMYSEAVQNVLDLFGGLQLCVQNRTRQEKGDFPMAYSTEYFRKERLPMLKEIFSQPQNRDKVLGCVVYQGYVNPVIGEYGTSALRHGMDDSLALNPDYILLFEWNEANENTSFQPSVYNGRAVTRILRYYSSIMKGTPLTPLEGDDTRRPNAIVSYRPALKLGETIYLELLNVPDGSMNKDYTLQLQLCNASGVVSHAFPEEIMRHDKLHAITYSLPSEQFAGEAFLQPQLLVNGVHQPGLGGIRLASTMCINYKELRQAIRELAVPECTVLEIRSLGDSLYKVHGEFASASELASVELLEDEDEIAAVDPSHEFDYEHNQQFYASFTTLKNIPTQTVELSIEGSSAWKIRPCYHCNVHFGKWKRAGDKVRFTGCNFGSAEMALLVELPKTDVKEALLTVNLPGRGVWTLPLQPAYEYGIYAQILESPLRLDIQRMDNLPDVPRHINQMKAVMDRIVRSAGKHPLYHLRVIGKDGSIFRTPLTMPVPLDNDAPKVEIDVFSDYYGKPVRVSVPEDSVPRIDYIFDPKAGETILNTSHPQFNGQLGGGFPYMEAFWEEPPNQASGPQPPVIPGSTRAPKWTMENGQWVLEFNGGNYINFNNRVLPIGAFTIECEIKPEQNDGLMVLFRHANRFTGSITLLLDNNTLRAEFYDKIGKLHKLNSDLPVPAGQWSSLKVSYDLQHLTFNVNGSKRSCPLQGRAFLFKSSIFGGHNGGDGVDFRGKKTSFYKGRLRRLSILHQAVE